MSASRWCLGWPPTRGPHVPDGQLIDTNIGPDIRLCDDCWKLWNAANWGDR